MNEPCSSGIDSLNISVSCVVGLQGKHLWQIYLFSSVPAHPIHCVCSSRIIVHVVNIIGQSRVCRNKYKSAENARSTCAINTSYRSDIIWSLHFTRRLNLFIDSKLVSRARHCTLLTFCYTIVLILFRRCQSIVGSVWLIIIVDTLLGHPGVWLLLVHYGSFINHTIPLIWRSIKITSGSIWHQMSVFVEDESPVQS